MWSDCGMDNDFEEDIYGSSVYDLDPEDSSSFSPTESIQTHMKRSKSCPETPPMKIPPPRESYNSDSVYKRRRSVTERRDSFSTASIDEHSFSPFSYGNTADQHLDFELDFDEIDPLNNDDIDGLENIDKEWMNKLHFLGGKMENTMSKKSFKRILNKFNKTATKIAKFIISEAHFPTEEKTVKPVSVGGIGGGEKYIYAGIFFKFAIDENGIYGGDMFAAKAAACELKAIRSIKIANITGLWAPYMTLIDYRGFRLIATTLLPISKETLKYGSDDGGLTVHKEDVTLNSLIELLGRKLNLKKHEVGLKNSTEIYGPADMEGHLGTDRRYYVLDAARLFPPFPPNETLLAFKISCNKSPHNIVTPLRIPFENWQDSITRLVDNYINDLPLEKKEFCSGVVFHGHQTDFFDPKKNNLASSLLSSTIYGDAILVYTAGSIGQKFHMLFRSELVISNKVPLSSDAFTKFEVGEMKEKNEEDIRAAYDRLIKVVIPSVARSLDGECSEHDAESVCREMHNNGINIRLLGELRKHIQTFEIDQIILKEMISRAIKTDMRGEMRKVDSINESECLAKTVSFMNLCFGNGEKSDEFWLFFIKTVIMFKFGEDALTKEEKLYSFDLRSFYFNKCTMFCELKPIIPAEFDEFSEDMFQTSNEPYQYQEPFHELDICKLTSKTKSSF